MGIQTKCHMSHEKEREKLLVSVTRYNEPFIYIYICILHIVRLLPSFMMEKVNVSRETTIVTILHMILVARMSLFSFSSRLLMNDRKQLLLVV